MIRFLVGGKGSGKTKRLIVMANEAVKKSDGHTVFIDDDRRHIYDLHYDIRFVETGEFPLSNYREFVGFICGILSQDGDIKEIFVDGLTNVIETLNDEDLLKLYKKLNALSEAHSFDFFISMNCEDSELPDEIKELVI